MIIFKRKLQEIIQKSLFKGSMVTILGPRQAGKTTLAKNILYPFKERGCYFDCQISEVRDCFIPGEPDRLKNLVKEYSIVVFDEAQTIQDIGTVLKVFHDKYPDIQIIATGSSSFDLSNKINEPMTGRVFQFILPPLSLKEINSKQHNYTIYDAMQYGLYPAVVSAPDMNTRELVLKNLVTNYLYKDVFIFESIRNPRVFEQMIKQLAFQVGQMVSVNELSKTLGISRSVVQKYLRLLEQSFIIKIIHSFSTNPRTELKKAFKVYFYDNGVRNVLAGINTPFNNRVEKGSLFENIFLGEIIKKHSLQNFPPDIMFWRTRTGIEIDFVEKDGIQITAYECKLSNQHVVFTKFIETYNNAKTYIVTPENISECM
jgi:predicted AAA+ superfamily ATPase